MIHRYRGFTLLEMLVSLSVAAILVSLVYGAVRVGQRSVFGVDKRVEESETMLIGWQFLRDALTRTHAIPSQQDDDDRTGFNGRPNALTFVADMPAYVGLGGLMRIGVRVERKDGEDQLVLTRQRFDYSDVPQTDEAEQRAVLIEDLDSIEIEYFGQPERDREPAWYQQWQKMETLPILVRVFVKPTEAARWPEMIAGLSNQAGSFIDEEGEHFIGDEHEAQATGAAIESSVLEQTENNQVVE